MDNTSFGISSIKLNTTEYLDAKKKKKKIMKIILSHFMKINLILYSENNCRVFNGQYISCPRAVSPWFLFSYYFYLVFKEADGKIFLYFMYGNTFPWKSKNKSRTATQQVKSEISLLFFVQLEISFSTLPDLQNLFFFPF